MYNAEWGLVEIGGHNNQIAGTDLDSMELTTDGEVWKTLPRIPGM